MLMQRMWLQTWAKFGTWFEHYISRKGHTYIVQDLDNELACALRDRSSDPIYKSRRSFTMRLCEIYSPVHGLKLSRFVFFIPSVALNYVIQMNKNTTSYVLRIIRIWKTRYPSPPQKKKKEKKRKKKKKRLLISVSQAMVFFVVLGSIPNLIP